LPNKKVETYSPTALQRYNSIYTNVPQRRHAKKKKMSKTILITGASSGIGKASAQKKFANEAGTSLPQCESGK
jgi:NADPH:quinone reductase-like Zn-dependent oxidoreductase